MLQCSHKLHTTTQVPCCTSFTGLPAKTSTPRSKSSHTHNFWFPDQATVRRWHCSLCLEDSKHPLINHTMVVLSPWLDLCCIDRTVNRRSLWCCRWQTSLTHRKRDARWRKCHRASVLLKTPTSQLMGCFIADGSPTQKGLFCPSVVPGWVLPPLARPLQEFYKWTVRAPHPLGVHSHPPVSVQHGGLLGLSRSHHPLRAGRLVSFMSYLCHENTSVWMLFWLCSVLFFNKVSQLCDDGDKYSFF